MVSRRLGRHAQVTASPSIPTTDSEPILRSSAIFPDLRAAEALDPVTMSALRRRAVLEGCKWDPQVGDVDTLTSFPLVLRRTVWKQLAAQAQRLAAEAAAAEEEISQRPQLLRKLGLPSVLCRLLAD